MPPTKGNQENEPTSPLDRPPATPISRVQRKSLRRTANKPPQLDDLPVNEASTVPAKRQKTSAHVQPSKTATAATSGLAIPGDKPAPTKTPAKGRVSKSTSDKKAVGASKDVPGTPTTKTSITATGKGNGKTSNTTSATGKGPPRPRPAGNKPGAHSAPARSSEAGEKPRAPSVPVESTGGAVSTSKSTAKSSAATSTNTRGQVQPQSSSVAGGAASNAGSDAEKDLELASLRAQLARANKKLERATQQKRKERKQADAQPKKLIPRPSGTMGKDWHLRAAMGLSDNKRLYSKILSDVRKLVIKGLDTSKGIRKQHPVQLGAVYEVARNKRPFLAQFENDWATAQIIIQYLANLRKQETASGSEGEGGKANGGKSKSRGKDVGQRHGKHSHGSPGAKDRLRAARAILRGQVDVEDSSSSSEDKSDDEGSGAEDDQEGSQKDGGPASDKDSGCDEDEEVEIEDAVEDEEVEIEDAVEDKDDEDDEEEDDEDMPPAKRRKVAVVLPEDD